MKPEADMTKNNENFKVGRIMIVDDETELMNALCEALTKQGYETHGFTAGADALKELTEQDYDLLLTDLMMPEMDGIVLLKAGLEIDQNLVGVIMTGHGTVQTAVEAMKLGAFDYILKPFKLGAILPLLSRAMGVRHLRLENMQLRETVAIHELGKAIAFSSNLGDILNKVADAALQQSGGDEVSIMLPTQENKELYVAVARGGRTDHVGARVPMEQGIAGWVARNREPAVLRGRVDDQRFSPINPRADIRAAVSMPMLAGGNLVGVLNVNVIQGHRHFALGEVKALGILVNIIAPILENTRLYIQVRQAEEKYRLHFENVTDIIFSIDPDLRLLSISPSVERTLGYKPEELAGKTIGELNITAPSSLEKSGSDIKRVLAGEQIEAALYEYRTKDGKKRFGEVSASPLLRDGKVVAAICVSRDITERREAEEWLIRERSFVDRIMKTSPAGIMVIDREGQIFFANKRAEGILSLTKDKITRLTFDAPEWHITDFDGNPFPHGQLPFMQVMITGNPVYGVRHAIELTGGQRVFLSINGAPILDEQGKVSEVVLTIDDVTQYRQAEEKIEQSLKKLQKSMNDTIKAMSMIVETRDPYTAGHQQEVSRLAVAIAEELNLPEEQIDGIRMAGVIHDIGKISVPAEILSKPGRLSSIELSLIKVHPESGYEILKGIDFSQPVADIVLQHQERMNGSGYPKGLQGKEILMEARIIAVADVVEAMAAHRPYRPARGIEAAMEEIEKNKGCFYDDAVVESCLKLFKEKGYQLK
ncbi:MAG TPA: HD domain-containing phosphohydrolase [Syntrophales bacterium]|nr:HD domain-containing phosphohydrolase [Syntrophales bacterium]